MIYSRPKKAVTIKTVNTATVIVICWTLVIMCVFKKKKKKKATPWALSHDLYVSSLGEETASGWVMGKLSDSSSSSYKSQESFELKVCQKCYCYETCNV